MRLVNALPRIDDAALARENQLAGKPPKPAADYDEEPLPLAMAAEPVN